MIGPALSKRHAIFCKLTGTIEYATIMDSLQPEREAAEPSRPSPAPAFHGADGTNYREPALAAARSLGREVTFESIAVPPGGCVVHAQDCWHGSSPNVSAHRHRRALVVHFIRGDAEFIGGHSLEVGGLQYTRALLPSRLDSLALGFEYP